MLAPLNARPFTESELRKLLNVSGDSDWRGMILLGVHCGLRLADAADLTWSNLDLQQGSITFQPKKTSHPCGFEATSPSRYILTFSFSSSHDRAELVKHRYSPNSHGQGTGSAGGLSNAFGRIMARAGVVVTAWYREDGKGAPLPQ
jgi:integrase